MNSIQRRLNLSLGAVSCLLGGIGGIALYLILRAGLLAEFDDALRANAESLSLQTEQSRTEFKFDPVGELMPAFERVEHADYFQLWLSDGSTLARSTSLQDHDLPRRDGARNTPRFWNLTLPNGHPGRAIGVRFVPPIDDEAPPKLRTELTLVVARDRTALAQRLNWLATTLVLVGVALAAAMVFVVAAVVRRGLQPLAGLAERAALIDASSLQLRFQTDHMPAELLPIAQRLNDLLARLETSFARERRFSADVAHELRTPIAELRTLAEVALKWPDDTVATRHTLQDALAIALQMESIATRLLDLARCEGGLLKVRPERVPLASLIREILQPLDATVRAKQLVISLKVAEDASWFTDSVALRCILTNLLSNAVEYSPAHAAIRVESVLDGNTGQLLISNPTTQLTGDDLAHLFDRFWRKDPARSSSVHCGLGLALAKAYAQSLGMDLRAELTGRSEITLALSGGQPCPASGTSAV